MNSRSPAISEGNPVRLTRLPNGDWTTNLTRPPPAHNLPSDPHAMHQTATPELQYGMRRDLAYMGQKEEPLEEGLRRLRGSVSPNHATLSDQCPTCGNVNAFVTEMCVVCSHILVNVPNYNEERIWQSLVRARRIQDEREL